MAHTREQQLRYNANRRLKRLPQKIENENRRNLVGRVFGKLTVISKVVYLGNNSHNRWLCKCDCGEGKIVFGYNLINGHTKSCSCLKDIAPESNITNNDTGSKEYRSWSSMKARCFNPSDNGFSDYGARGITVCDRWLKYENFLDDMGRIPQEGMTLNRKDNDGIYEKDNCNWATDLEQANNKRNNHFITFNEERLTIAQWSRRLGINYHTFYAKRWRGVDKIEIVIHFYKKKSIELQHST